MYSLSAKSGSNRPKRSGNDITASPVRRFSVEALALVFRFLFTFSFANRVAFYRAGFSFSPTAIVSKSSPKVPSASRDIRSRRASLSSPLAVASTAGPRAVLRCGRCVLLCAGRVTVPTRLFKICSGQLFRFAQL